MSEPFIDIKQTVSLMNQERSNNKLYVSLVEPRPTVFYEDKTLPSLPASIMNVMQTGPHRQPPPAVALPKARSSRAAFRSTCSSTAATRSALP